MRIKAVIFDWAGTVVDYGSRAPVLAFTELFRRHGVAAPPALTRRFMGSHKKDHIRLMLEDAALRAEWLRVNRADPDIESLYTEFIPIQVEMIARHADVIPGVPELCKELLSADIRIGSTTGYVRKLMGGLLEAAAANGFSPDCVVCADEVPAGRPAPWMALRAAMLMNAWPIAACVKVGDTVADIGEGLNGGMWTVGVTQTGNELGLSAEQASALPEKDLESRLEAARHRFLRAGAHYAISSVEELIPVLEEIEARLEVGARPST
jgi:phosphonoacetaldehyde hydrolase